jgi:hypothetical protein
VTTALKILPTWSQDLGSLSGAPLIGATVAKRIDLGGYKSITGSLVCDVAPGGILTISFSVIDPTTRALTVRSTVVIQQDPNQVNTWTWTELAITAPIVTISFLNNSAVNSNQFLVFNQANP